METQTHLIKKIQLPYGAEALYTRSYGLEDHKDHIIFFHDIGEYHGRYLDFSKYFLEKQIGITFVDMRGHGLSSGTRGHCDSYQTLLDDYHCFWQHYEEHFQDKNIYTVGHGVGALIALVFMLEHKEVKGSALTNPSIKYNSKYNHNFDDFLYTTSFIDKIRVSYNSLNSISKERQLITTYEHDPLINKKLTVSMFRVVSVMLEELKRMSYFVGRPVLYQIGEEDEIVDLEKSRLYASSFDENILTLKTYKNLGHELFNEIDRDKAYKDIYNWIRDCSKIG